MATPKNIVVVRLSAMGDVAMTVPILRVFSQTYPEVKITLISRGFFKPFFQDIPNLTFLEADVYGKHKGVFGLLRLAKEALALEVDAVADLHNVLRSKILSTYFRLKGKKVAVIDKGRREKKALTAATNKIFAPLKTTHQRYADVFAALGFPIDLKQHQPVSNKPMTPKISELIRASHLKIVGVAPFAAHQGKVYPLTLMRKVLEALNADGRYRVLLFGGGKSEIEQLDKLSENLPEVVRVAGKLSFEEELILISNLDVMVSMDSGNGHLAALFSVPVLTLWGVTHPYAGFAPFEQPESHQLLADREKYPLIPTSIYGNTYPDGYENVMATITPTQVAEAIASILS